MQPNSCIRIVEFILDNFVKEFKIKVQRAAVP